VKGAAALKRTDPNRTACLENPASIRPITDHEFALFQALIHKVAGIYLCPIKKALLVGRLNKRLRELGLHSFRQYYDRIKQGDREELVCMLDSISTNETQFFRQPRQFQFLEEQVFPQWSARAAAHRMPRRIRAWSTGCSTGQEPYTLAMILLDHFPPSSGWAVEILATDLSTRALERARKAVWPVEKADEIPEKYLKSYMLKGTGKQQGIMKAGPEISSIVRFGRVNLNDDTYPVAGPFDLIFCRNVLIYFDVESKTRVIHRLLDYLAPDGYLFIGQAEGLHGLTDRVRSVFPTVYGHADPQKTGLRK
jgi:chemotaxis protein methyltransferase CheR